MNREGKSKAAVFMNHAKIAKMLRTHAMNSTTPGFHHGYFRSKRSITPL